jgi:hypothetical protein
LKPTSKKSPDLLLYQHEGQNPFSGAYTNAIYARRRANGRFTVWVKAWSIDGATEDCWHKDLASAAEFISACQTCLEFVEFGEADVVDVIRGGFDGLKKLDASFAEVLRAGLLDQFSEDCAVGPADRPAVDDEGAEVTRLSNEEARQKYGSAMIFIHGPSAESAEDDPSEAIPEVGDKRGKLTLVAKGDDFPDEWDGWLDELVDGYSSLVTEALRKKVDPEALGLVEGPEGLKAFAEQIGVAFEQEFWEGACISGQYQLGWIRTSEIRRAQRGARQLLAHIEQKLTESCKT